jgi:NADPH:quinone reductase-like Zn-dependent oxidoreductase
MRAVVFESFGDPDVLHVSEVAIPEPGRGQVRLAVRAVGVNPIDAAIRSGAMRAILETALPKILGIDVAGIVDAVGNEVTDLDVGDEAVGWADPPAGGYAEYALASQVARIPAGLSFIDAATLPVATEAAKRGLDLLNVAPGDTVLVHGAAGSVGTMAVQLAVARGATVIGTASAANQDYVRSLGGTPVQYGPGLVARVRALTPVVDAALDVAGKGGLADSITLVGGTERVLTIADPAARSLGVRFSAGGPDARSTKDLTHWLTLAAHGDLATTIAGTYPLERAADAHRASVSGHAPGKLVLTTG